MTLPSMISPVGAYLMHTYAGISVPRELIDAARIDGAGELLIFLRIALPLVVPGVLIVLLINVPRSGTTTSCRRWSSTPAPSTRSPPAASVIYFEGVAAALPVDSCPDYTFTVVCPLLTPGGAACRTGPVAHRPHPMRPVRHSPQTPPRRQGSVNHRARTGNRTSMT